MMHLYLHSNEEKQIVKIVEIEELQHADNQRVKHAQRSF